jgi:hypothetical protein
VESLLVYSLCAGAVDLLLVAIYMLVGAMLHLFQRRTHDDGQEKGDEVDDCIVGKCVHDV